MTGHRRLDTTATVNSSFTLGIALCLLAACRAPGGDVELEPTTTVVPTGAGAAESAAPAAGASDPAAAAEVSSNRAAWGEPPRYPPISRRLGEEGTVALRIEVAPTGTVEGVEVVQSSGYARLDEAALDAARLWRFPPWTGQSARPSILHRVVFRLTPPS